jgi:PAS domain S-box-containing protein
MESLEGRRPMRNVDGDHFDIDLLGEALGRGDDYFRDVLDGLPAAVYITDAAGLLTYYNEAAAALWGYRPPLGFNHWCGSWKLYRPDGRALPHDQSPMAIALREKRPVRGMEALAERPDGIRVPFIPYPTPFYDAAGDLLGAVNMLVDITDRKRAEEYAERLAAIVTSSDDAIVSKDLNGVIITWNQGAERLFGYSAEEAIGKPIQMLIPPDRQDEEPEILARIRRGEKIDHYETVRRRKDGTLVDISLTVSPVRNGDGQVIGASKIARDITERRQGQHAAELLASIVESSDDAILTKDLDGVITSWNRGAERIFGYTAEEAIGKPVTILMPDDYLDEEAMILGRIRKGERIDHYETVRQRKDGSRVNISLTVSPVRNAAGTVIGASKVARDITGRLRGQEQQQLVLREMDHRIKNLFSLAGGVVNLSARSAKTPKELAASVGERLGALARAHALTVARHATVANPGERPATLHALIKAVTSPYEDGTDGNDERIAVAGVDVPLSEASVTSLALLLHEFSTNAAKYGALSTPQGRVEVQCRDEDGVIVLTWKERGGPPVAQPTSDEGFGTVLIRTAVEGQLDGAMSRDWNPEGLTIRLSAPRGRLTGDGA